MSHISRAEIKDPRNFPYTQKAYFSQMLCTNLLTSLLVSVLSFIKIIHPPDRCGISRRWLNSMIITQVYLVLGTRCNHTSPGPPHQASSPVGSSEGEGCWGVFMSVIKPFCGKDSFWLAGPGSPVGGPSSQVGGPIPSQAYQGCAPNQSCEIHRLGPNSFNSIDWFPYMNCNSAKSLKLLHATFIFLFSVYTFRNSVSGRISIAARSCRRPILYYCIVVYSIVLYYMIFYDILLYYIKFNVIVFIIFYYIVLFLLHFCLWKVDNVQMSCVWRKELLFKKRCAIWSSQLFSQESLPYYLNCQNRSSWPLLSHPQLNPGSVS